MQAPILHKLHDQHLWLSAQRSIFWEEQKALIVSDLHFGKTGHFRKSGIPVPQGVYKEDLQRLVNLLHYFKPQKLLVVGDFFHSHANMELDWFKKWREDFSSLQIILVRGNHDILKRFWYQEAGIEVIENELELAPFIFTHERCEDHDTLYTFCGHIHPGIYLQGLGKQALRLPCFYFGANHCILPAFSKFTGTALIEPEPKENVFAIVDNSLVQMQ
ncbi:MAG TPA: ligase-associated DNA damage response endonuclease PdeM [Flavisolibacter sp.]|nr:ligase-associated DNA damage response endonuclease PdeM [Flavisolibacter sp.]